MELRKILVSGISLALVFVAVAGAAIATPKVSSAQAVGVCQEGVFRTTRSECQAICLGGECVFDDMEWWWRCTCPRVCPKFLDGELSDSDISINPDKVRELDEVAKRCSDIKGIGGLVSCFIAVLFADLTGTGNLTLKNSRMPGYLRAANELMLSGDKGALLGTNPEKRNEPGAITGAIAKMLIPRYTQDGWDPILKLTESQGQLVTGTIPLNEKALQKKFTKTVFEAPEDGANPGYYDLQGTGNPSVYEVPARFGEVSPLYDRFGLLRQALTPPTSPVTIPNVVCPYYDPTVLAVTGFVGQNPQRDAPWTTFKRIPGADLGTEDVPCSERYGCPSEIPGKTYIVGGNLDTQSKVSLASSAWERIGAPSHSAGQGGVFNILLPPGESFRTDDADVQINYYYDAHSGAESPKTVPLKIADLGNVQGSMSCIVDALTEHPARADDTACARAFGLEEPIFCTDEALPLSFPNTSRNAAARKAWEIVNNLYQGYWCRWNKKLEPPPKVFIEPPNPYARDLHPPFPGPIQRCTECLYWCTYLIIDVLPDAPHGGAMNSDAMLANYRNAGRFIAFKDATPLNIPVGSAVFFQTAPNRTAGHVGLVYSVSSIEIKYIHSNAFSKEGTIPFAVDTRGNYNGTVSETPWGTPIVGFGTP